MLSFNSEFEQSSYALNRIVPSFGTYIWNATDQRLILLLVTSYDFEESCR
nr:hypothetical protein [Tanacetum cinerariifolium]